MTTNTDNTVADFYLQTTPFSYTKNFLTMELLTNTANVT